MRRAAGEIGVPRSTMQKVLNDAEGPQSRKVSSLQTLNSTQLVRG